MCIRDRQKAQPFLDALEIASERVRAFVNSILIRGQETQEHKHPAQKLSLIHIWHAHRSCTLLIVFRARSVPGNSVSQMPAAPFLPVCLSRGYRYSSSYRQGLHPRLFPRRARLWHRKAADCGFHGQLSDILPQEQGRSYTSWKTGWPHLWCYGTALSLIHI